MIVKATFVGQDSSLRYEKGKRYVLNLVTDSSYIHITKIDGGGNCAYISQTVLCRNWSNITIGVLDNNFEEIDKALKKKEKEKKEIKIFIVATIVFSITGFLIMLFTDYKFGVGLLAGSIIALLINTATLLIVTNTIELIKLMEENKKENLERIKEREENREEIEKLIAIFNDEI